MLAQPDSLRIVRENWVTIKPLNGISFEDMAAFPASFDQLLQTIETDLIYLRRLYDLDDPPTQCPQFMNRQNG